jgi:hypothetical protein
MQIRMDRKDEIPLVEWEEFLATARRAGATDDAAVAEITQNPDSAFVMAYAIDVERDEDFEGPQIVTIPADILHDLLHVVRYVANSDGDVRGLEEAARNSLDAFNDHFLTPAIGPNPWTDGDEDDSEAES